MRMKVVQIAAIALLALAMGLPQAAAQNPDMMMPAESEAKGKQILAQLIAGLGGPAFQSVKESACEGRQARFGSNGEMTGFIEFKSYWRYPDKYRVDYSKKGNIIDLFNGDEGWTLDRGGVSEEPAPAVADFQGAVKRNLDNVLRERLKNGELTVRFGGNDIVELKQVNWVDMQDHDGREMRVAVDSSAHLPVRYTVTIEDLTTREKHEETTLYANFHPQDGVQTALQVTRLRDGRRVFQAFYKSCTYRPNLAPNFFSKDALDKRAADLGVKPGKN